MILTAIVIAMGIAAFVLALTYRSFRLTTEEVDDDPGDTRLEAFRRRGPGSMRMHGTRNASRHRRSRMNWTTRCPGMRVAMSPAGVLRCRCRWCC